jgi:hypothetical protein
MGEGQTLERLLSKDGKSGHQAYDYHRDCMIPIVPKFFRGDRRQIAADSRHDMRA